MSVIHLNCKGLHCPMPIVETGRQYKKLQIGDFLEVEADDPAFKPDLEAWVECMGYKLVKISGSRIITAVLEKTDN